MRVLVTGGAGFIGSAVVRYLVVQKGYEVLTVDKLTYAGSLLSLKAVEDHPRHRFLKGDICDSTAIQEAFGSFRPHRVMHLAAESHVDRSISGARRFVETNVVGTFTLLECARSYWSTLPAHERDAFRFLHVSTDEVYGSLGETGSFSEETRYAPNSPYSASKAASDHFARAWARTHGLPVIVSNCSNNYGPYQFPEKLIALTILNTLEGRPLPVYGSGTNIRDWLYVEDHVKALDLIAELGRPGETYNVGADSEWQNIDVVREVCALMDRFNPGGAPHAELITFVTDRPGHDARYAIDTGKIRRELGWRPLESFESGLEKTVRWYIENEWWWGPLKQVYARERLDIDVAPEEAEA